jgi:hypothetical protein
VGEARNANKAWKGTAAWLYEQKEMEEGVTCGAGLKVLDERAVMETWPLETVT